MKKIGMIFVILLVSGLLFASVGYKLVVPESDIIFSHQFHVEEQELECEACHLDIAASELSLDKNMPTMDECAVCHDVEDDDLCGSCHKNVDEPMAIPDPEREIIFSHRLHIELNTECAFCHSDIASSDTPSDRYMPTKPICFSCHDDKKATRKCQACHSSGISVSDIHPSGWKNIHGTEASVREDYCAKCHADNNFCIDCHRGDNIDGTIHDLNYFFTHGLDAKSNQKNCSHCHDNQQFCVSCHESELRMPLNHSKLNWRLNHKFAALNDIESCANCHESTQPSTCATIGCHSDFDGIRGTDPKIHLMNPSYFDSEGEWHDNEGAYCFDCHVSSRESSTGFCNYCHSYSPGGD